MKIDKVKDVLGLENGADKLSRKFGDIDIHDVNREEKYEEAIDELLNEEDETEKPD